MPNFADVIEIMHACEDAQMRVRAAAGLGRYRGPEVFEALGQAYIVIIHQSGRRLYVNRLGQCI